MERDGDGWRLANGLLVALVDSDGLLTSVLDVATGREALAPGSRGNLLQLHADTPVRFDAWDVDSYYRRSVTDLVALGDGGSLEAVEGGVRVVRTVGASRIEQRVTLPAGEARVDIATEVDWQEREKLLKAGLRPRRQHRAGRLRGAVRARPPADAREHELGRRALRGVRAPLGARRRAGLRGRRSPTTRPTATT